MLKQLINFETFSLLCREQMLRFVFINNRNIKYKYFNKSKREKSNCMGYFCFKRNIYIH